ncbi:glycosyltransferase family 4 protein [Tenacibaculum sp. FZY0031]|uniref:glycosyltransferase family 4 protein n=1 Tax=Tenacibaculum sp. FZY0031 TaxID=3116648 RepID=UPI002EAA7DFF|nr:glycosyltransferase family 4 protein [Tenacibaculum sp. FZY0031]
MKKKIIYIHQYFTFPESSGGTRSYDLSKKFILNGFDVTFLTTSSMIKDFNNPKNKNWVYLEREGIKFWVLDCNYNQRMSVPQRLKVFFKFFFYSSIKITQLKADLVLATSTPLTTSIPALVKKFYSKTPYIFEARDIWPEGPIQLGYVKNRLIIKMLRIFEKFIYKQASHVVVLSVGMKRCILERMGEVNKIGVIPNISEIKRFENISNQIELPFDFKNKKVVLYAGTLGPVNNIMYVAELAKKLINQNIKNIVFLILGDGNEKEKTVSYCREHGLLNNNMFFMDNIPKNSLPYLYSKVTMGSSFVLDNKIKWDNSANKFFDTLAAGKPILINYQGWQADLIKEKNCGYILPAHPSDIDALDFAEYLKDDKLLSIQSANSKEIGSKEFSLDILSSKYLHILNTVVKNGKQNI